ncbi:hypothetical protein HK098_004705 [Nowakowskiella sp. JEL0407]|nr:hypothetical protein HK098_004705 [Nowakowskiella sp. JEL0407]
MTPFGVVFNTRKVVRQKSGKKKVINTTTNAIEDAPISSLERNQRHMSPTSPTPPIDTVEKDETRNDVFRQGRATLKVAPPSSRERSNGPPQDSSYPKMSAHEEEMPTTPTILTRNASLKYRRNPSRNRTEEKDAESSAPNSNLKRSNSAKRAEPEKNRPDNSRPYHTIQRPSAQTNNNNKPYNNSSENFSKSLENVSQKQIPYQQKFREAEVSDVPKVPPIPGIYRSNSAKRAPPEKKYNENDRQYHTTRRPVRNEKDNQDSSRYEDSRKEFSSSNGDQNFARQNTTRMVDTSGTVEYTYGGISKQSSSNPATTNTNSPNSSSRNNGEFYKSQQSTSQKSLNESQRNQKPESNTSDPSPKKPKPPGPKGITREEIEHLQQLPPPEFPSRVSSKTFIEQIQMKKESIIRSMRNGDPPPPGGWNKMLEKLDAELKSLEALDDKTIKNFTKTVNTFERDQARKSKKVSKEPEKKSTLKRDNNTVRKNGPVKSLAWEDVESMALEIERKLVNDPNKNERTGPPPIPAPLNQPHQAPNAQIPQSYRAQNPQITRTTRNTRAPSVSSVVITRHAKKPSTIVIHVPQGPQIPPRQTSYQLYQAAQKGTLQTLSRQQTLQYREYLNHQSQKPMPPQVKEEQRPEPKLVPLKDEDSAPKNLQTKSRPKDVSTLSRMLSKFKKWQVGKAAPTAVAPENLTSPSSSRVNEKPLDRHSPQNPKSPALNTSKGSSGDYANTPVLPYDAYSTPPPKSSEPVEIKPIPEPLQTRIMNNASSVPESPATAKQSNFTPDYSMYNQNSEAEKQRVELDSQSKTPGIPQRSDSTRRRPKKPEGMLPLQQQGPIPSQSQESSYRLQPEPPKKPFNPAIKRDEFDSPHSAPIHQKYSHENNPSPTATNFPSNKHINNAYLDVSAPQSAPVYQQYASTNSSSPVTPNFPQHPQYQQQIPPNRNVGLQKVNNNLNPPQRRNFDDNPHSANIYTQARNLDVPQPHSASLYPQHRNLESPQPNSKQQRFPDQPKPNRQQLAPQSPPDYSPNRKPDNDNEYNRPHPNPNLFPAEPPAYFYTEQPKKISAGVDLKYLPPPPKFNLPSAPTTTSNPPERSAGVQVYNPEVSQSSNIPTISDGPRPPKNDGTLKRVPSKRSRPLPTPESSNSQQSNTKSDPPPPQPPKKEQAPNVENNPPSRMKNEQTFFKEEPEAKPVARTFSEEIMEALQERSAYNSPDTESKPLPEPITKVVDGKETFADKSNARKSNLPDKETQRMAGGVKRALERLQSPDSKKVEKVVAEPSSYLKPVENPVTRSKSDPLANLKLDTASESPDKSESQKSVDVVIKSAWNKHPKSAKPIEEKISTSVDEKSFERADLLGESEDDSERDYATDSNMNLVLMKLNQLAEDHRDSRFIVDTSDISLLPSPITPLAEKPNLQIPDVRSVEAKEKKESLTLNQMQFEAFKDIEDEVKRKTLTLTGDKKFNSEKPLPPDLSLIVPPRPVSTASVPVTDSPVSKSFDRKRSIRLSVQKPKDRINSTIIDNYPKSFESENAPPVPQIPAKFMQTVTKTVDLPEVPSVSITPIPNRKSEEEKYFIYSDPSTPRDSHVLSAKSSTPRESKALSPAIPTPRESKLLSPSSTPRDSKIISPSSSTPRESKALSPLSASSRENNNFLPETLRYSTAISPPALSPVEHKNSTANLPAVISVQVDDDTPPNSSEISRIHHPWTDSITSDILEEFNRHAAEIMAADNSMDLSMEVSDEAVVVNKSNTHDARTEEILQDLSFKMQLDDKADNLEKDVLTDDTVKDTYEENEEKYGSETETVILRDFSDEEEEEEEEEVEEEIEYEEEIELQRVPVYTPFGVIFETRKVVKKVPKKKDVVEEQSETPQEDVPSVMVSEWKEETDERNVEQQPTPPPEMPADLPELTYEQKVELSEAIALLPPEAHETLFEIIRASPTYAGESGEEGEIELDVDTLDPMTLYVMNEFVKRTIGGLLDEDGSADGSGNSPSAPDFVSGVRD